MLKRLVIATVAVVALLAGTSSFAGKSEIVKRVVGTAAKPGTKHLARGVLSADQPLRRISVTSLIPENSDDFARTFGPDPPTPAQVREIEESLAALRQINKPGYQFTTAHSAESLTGMIRRRSVDMEIVLAHSVDQGKTLIFPSGHKLQLGLLRKECADRGAACLVVTCFSPDLNLNTQIDLRTAAMAVEMAIRQWEPATSAAGLVRKTRSPRGDDDIVRARQRLDHWRREQATKAQPTKAIRTNQYRTSTQLTQMIGQSIQQTRPRCRSQISGTTILGATALAAGGLWVLSDQ